MVKDDAIRILDTHRIMAISTVRPDGWPQTTIVGYANVGLALYFLIFRSSQKFANIERDDRISIAVGEEPTDMRELNAVFAGAHAAEVTDAGEREDAWRLLRQRHPNLASFELPEPSAAALMRAECKYLSVLDYRTGAGYGRSLTIGTDGEPIAGDANDDWGAHVAGKDA
jgi:nitroimidazol reductase NimA-like FMN-containing flavoprotein (pyridoxamine 5'-phosphate oxidase superfamily)